MRLPDYLSAGFKSLFILFLTGIFAGCTTCSVHRARHNFYSSNFQRAENSLRNVPSQNKDTILYLLERGMIRQCMHKYNESCDDWRTASELDKQRETYSISHGATSFVFNDRSLPFRGKLYERSLLFTFLAKNYLARYNWDYAAICSRNIIALLENREGFPDIAYSRYMAGFCLVLIDDSGNAALQYQIASDLVPSLRINENTGRLIPEGETQIKQNVLDTDNSHELVCFIGIGKVPAGTSDSFPLKSASAPYAEIYHHSHILGRSYVFNDLALLIDQTEERLSLIKLAKETSRIALKEAIAASIEKNNKAIGSLTRLALFAFEIPDTRRWETLPRWLEIARVPCPASLDSYTIVFKTSSGKTITTKTITEPISRNGNIFISFCRDISE